MIPRQRTIAFLVALLFVHLPRFCPGFSVLPVPPAVGVSARSHSRVAQVASLNAGFLQNLFGSADEESGGPKVVLDIPAANVKIGALRFLLQIYLVGEQNKPTPQSWLTRQGDGGELQVYYQDGTGMLSIELQEYSVKVRRFGERPSLPYLLQENVLLHGVLDELDNVAFRVDDIEAEKRLLRLHDSSALTKAREALPARQA